MEKMSKVEAQTVKSLTEVEPDLEVPRLLDEARRKEDVRDILYKHATGFVGDVVPTLRILASNLVIFGSFLICDELVIYLISLTSSNLTTRYPFITEIIDIADLISLIASVFYFILNVYLGFQSQRRINQSIEKRVNGNE